MKKELQNELLQQVSEFYESEGEAFAHTRHHVWELMLDFIKQLKPGMLLVDVGSGNSRMLDVIPDGVSYVGIEPSSTLRKAAQERVAKHLGAATKAGSLPKIDLPDDFADAITCIAVLHHLPSEEMRWQAVVELRRILKPGGKLLVSVWNLRAIRFFSWEMFKHAWLRIPGIAGGDPGDLYYKWKAGGVDKQRYVHAFTLSEFKKLFSDNDWQVEAIGAYDKQGWTNMLQGRNLVATLIKK